MRPEVVVLVTPFLDGLAGVFQVLEPMEIQTLIPEFAIETLDETVFDGPAWSNENQLHPIAVGPLVQSLAGELRTVVDDDSLR
jgi:hypothetical protein